MTDQHITLLTEIIENRRSTFPAQFTGETIDEDIIHWLLHNAIQAPSHKHVNPWRFRVVAGQKINELADFFKTTYIKETSKEVFNEAKLKSFEKKLNNTSHVLIISMKEDPSRPLPEWENIAATASAVQNIYLSIAAAGLGGYWSSPTLMMKHINSFAEMQENETCLGFFYLGIPQKNLPPQINKGAIESYVSWL